MNLEEQERLNQRNRGNLPQQEKKYWFKPKTYGWGVTPVTLEGWGITFLFMGVLFLIAWGNGLTQEVVPVSNKDMILFFIETLVSVFGFIQLIKNRVEGGLKWHWGS